MRTDERPDGPTHMTKLIVAFRNFANAPKKSVHSVHDIFMCFVFISGPAIQHKLIGFYNRNEVFTARYGLLPEAASLVKKMPKYVILSLC